jgi:hypothetical protein
MGRASLLYWTALAALLAFLLQVFSGFALWLAFAEGPVGGRGGAPGLARGQEEFLGLGRNDWLDLHDWTAVSLMAILALHLLMNWRWVISVTGRVLRGRT